MPKSGNRTYPTRTRYIGPLTVTIKQYWLGGAIVKVKNTNSDIYLGQKLTHNYYINKILKENKLNAFVDKILLETKKQITQHRNELLNVISINNQREALINSYFTRDGK